MYIIYAAEKNKLAPKLKEKQKDSEKRREQWLYKNNTFAFPHQIEPHIFETLPHSF